MYKVVHTETKHVIAECKTYREAREEMMFGEDMMRDAGVYQEGMFEIEEDDQE